VYGNMTVAPYRLHCTLWHDFSVPAHTYSCSIALQLPVLQPVTASDGDMARHESADFPKFIPPHETCKLVGKHGTR